MESISNISSIEVVHDWVTESARGEKLKFMRILLLLVQEWGVVSCRKYLLSFALDRVIHLRIRIWSITNSMNVVDVYIAYKILEFIEKIHAYRSCVLHFSATEVTLISLESVVHLRAVKGVPVSHFHVCWCAIILIVCHTISNCKTLKVGLKYSVIISIDSVVLINCVSEVRNIYSSVGLTRNIKFVCFELWEFFKPGKDCGEIILSNNIVIPRVALLDSLAVAETNTSR